jgi:hypothetical protein
MVKDLDQGLNDWGMADPLLNGAWLVRKPLLGGIIRVEGRMADFKERVRAYYFEVLLSLHQCPGCGGRLKMTGQSMCSCSCGKTLDPTLEFQRSPCCGARLDHRTFHYACPECHEVVPSRFIFDERVFDSGYFREMMRESRARAKQRKEEIGRLLLEARSDVLPLLEEPKLESIHGLLEDLDLFVQQGSQDFPSRDFEPRQEFSMVDYRDHILSVITGQGMLFTEIAPFAQEERRDKAWRFITLVFMQNDRVVDLIQEGENIWVQRLSNEAHA